MIKVVLLLLQQVHQSPDAHYAGGASSQTAGTTALAGHLYRFLLSTVPQWVQLAGIFVGVPVGMYVAYQAWRHRRRIWAWWLGRSVPVKAAIGTTLTVVVLAGAGSGLYSYNYVMHENDFCQSCHNMDAAWNRFQTSAHKNLECHACHRQPLYVGSVELFWWVGTRQMEVPAHDKVPRRVCSECHLRQGTDSARTMVMLTAGHAVHLQSDSASLKNIECVACHGRDFHVFKPTTATCAQVGCHTTVKVKLGAMSKQGFMHCTICHDFKGLVAPGATVAQGKAGLTPKALNCAGCHTMAQKIDRFDLDADPHKGSCGSCHDAHKQTEPKDAYKTCVKCHNSVDTLTAFHRGLGVHKIDQCGACHQAHSWRVKGTDCIACHKNINRERPPPPPPEEDAPASGPSDAPPRSVAQQVPRDTAFPHSRHTSVKCTECHATNSTHGGLKFVRPEGCQSCHHSTAQRAPCVACHATTPPGAHAMPVAFAITARAAPVTRTLTFEHGRHATLACTSCHGNTTARAVTSTCASCHDNHHTAGTDCASCHATARTGHNRSVHEGCAKCHTDARVSALPVSRTTCVLCHQTQRDHYPARECATCHAVAARDMLRGGRAGDAP